MYNEIQKLPNLFDSKKGLERGLKAEFGKPSRGANSRGSQAENTDTTLLLFLQMKLAL